MDLSLLKERIAAAFSDYLSAIIRSIPGILGGLLLLLVGWGLAKLLRTLVHRIIHSTGLHAMAEKGGLGRLFGRLGGLAVIISGLVFWVVQLFFILASATVMDMSLITEAIHRFFEYLPVLLTASGIFVFGIWMGDKVQNVATGLGSSMGLVGSKVIGRLFFFIIVLFMSITALNMAGVDTTLITSNLLLLLGGILIAFSVSYGFASRNILANILSSYYGRERFHPGQRVRIGNDEGVIERIDSISVLLRTSDRLVRLPTRTLIDQRIEILDEPDQHPL